MQITKSGAYCEWSQELRLGSLLKRPVPQRSVGMGPGRKIFFQLIFKHFKRSMKSCLSSLDYSWGISLVLTCMTHFLTVRSCISKTVSIRESLPILTDFNVPDNRVTNDGDPQWRWTPGASHRSSLVIGGRAGGSKLRIAGSARARG